jgi:protocatechuate 4,5-dioxygenase beta chain
MAKIVSAIASTHNPRIFWNRAQADQNALDRLYGAFDETRKLLADSKPDIIVVIANDHLDGLFFDNMPAFSVVTGPQAAGPYWYETEIMHLPDYNAAIAEDAAKSILRAGREEGIYFSQLHDFKIDHAFTLPLSFVRPERDIPIVPIVTNTFGYPLVPTKHWFQLGKFLRDAVASWPAHLRVAVVASFNLTVEVGGPKAGKYNMEFTRWLVDQMSAGHCDELVASLTVPRLIREGNSTSEFLNYISLLGIIEDRKPNFIEHRPVPGVGMCPVAFWNLA